MNRPQRARAPTKTHVALAVIRKCECSHRVAKDRKNSSRSEALLYACKPIFRAAECYLETREQILSCFGIKSLPFQASNDFALSDNVALGFGNDTLCPWQVIHSQSSCFHLLHGSCLA